MTKPKKIRHGDPNNMIGKFAVMHCLHDRKSIRFTVLHETYDAAIAEAKRMSAIEGGSFLVVCVLAAEAAGQE